MLRTATGVKKNKNKMISGEIFLVYFVFQIKLNKKIFMFSRDSPPRP